MCAVLNLQIGIDRNIKNNNVKTKVPGKNIIVWDNGVQLSSISYELTLIVQNQAVKVIYFINMKSLTLFPTSMIYMAIVANACGFKHC